MTNGINVALRAPTEHEKTLAENAKWSIALEEKEGVDQFRDALSELKTRKRGSEYRGEEVWRYMGWASKAVGRKEVPNFLLLIDRIFVAHQDWGTVQMELKHLGHRIGLKEVVEGFKTRMKPVVEAFGKLKEDFDEAPRRIVRCALLEEELANFESSLEDDETEYLAWCVSLIRDVLDYNYAENLTKSHLGLLKKAIDTILKKGPDCSEEDCQNLHKECLEAGLALIPTTQKAIDKYGQ